MATDDTDPAAHWDNRYAERDRIWSGRPNAALVATITGIPPGRALDLGCGEGGDGIWLAEQGWRVIGVDVSGTAISRAAAAAAARGIGDDRITWVTTDLSTWDPPESYDLVSACFFHSTIDLPRTAILRRAAAAVRPGGLLLVVGHAEVPPWSRHRDHGHETLLGPAAELAALDLTPGGWETVVNEVRSREATAPDGERAVLSDAVTLVRRR
ncbi:MAG: class I SAM-dependent methyltransferase [Actinomycetota bacterium]|nr:MAG: class I SAM-dependent methyltransferase [Actinomycetota bacterium]